MKKPVGLYVRYKRRHSVVPFRVTSGGSWNTTSCNPSPPQEHLSKSGLSYRLPTVQTVCLLGLCGESQRHKRHAFVRSFHKHHPLDRQVSVGSYASWFGVLYEKSSTTSVNLPVSGLYSRVPMSPVIPAYLFFRQDTWISCSPDDMSLDILMTLSLSCAIAADPRR